MGQQKGTSEGRRVRFRCHGHRNLKASHSKTVELTRETNIGPRATCVIGVGADYDPDTLARLRGTLKITLRLASPGEGIEQQFLAVASPLIKTSHSLVFRRSSEISGNTFAIEATLGAKDLDRRLATALGQPETILEVEIAEFEPTTEDASEKIDGSPERSSDQRYTGALVILPLDPWDNLSRRALETLPSLEALISPDLKRLRQMGWPCQARELLPCQQLGDLSPIARRLEKGERLGLVVHPAQLQEGSASLQLVREASDSDSVVIAMGFAAPGQTALMASGLPAEPVLMLPPLANRRDLDPWLDTLCNADFTVVWQSSPTRVRPTLQRLEPLGQDRPIVVMKDPGGRREACWRGSVQKVLAALPSPIQGSEGIFIVLGRSEESSPGTGSSPGLATFRPFLTALLEEGVHVRTLSKCLARTSSTSQRDAYNELLRLRQGKETD